MSQLPRILLGLGLLSALSLQACSGRKPGSFPEGKVIQRTGGDPIFGVKDEDREMNAAIAKAQSTLGEFTTELARPQKDTDYIVKVRFRTDGGSGEHIWLDQIRFDGGNVTGRLTDEPDAIARYHKGQTVTAPRVDITDWLISGPAVTRGGYTQDVIDHRTASGGR